MFRSVRVRDSARPAHSRISAVDTDGAWAQHDPDNLRRVRPLLGKEYPSFSAACQAAHQAYHPEHATTEYLCTFQCYVVGLEPEHAKLLRRGTVVERMPDHGKMVVTRFTPELATLVVDILPDETRGGEWMSIGALRPIVHVREPDEQVKAAVEQMSRKARPPKLAPSAACTALSPPRHTTARPPSRHEAHASPQGFEKQKHSRDRHSRADVEEGEVREGPKKARRSRKKLDLVAGKHVFVDEAARAAGDGGPHVIVSSDLMPPPENPSQSACRVATLRSLADGTERHVTAGCVVSLASCFEARCKAHLCAAEPRCGACVAMLHAVRAEGARCTPPTAPDAKWRELAPNVAVPAGL